MEKGGGALALAHFLFAFKISGWSSRTIPITSYLKEQKELSMPPVHMWWLLCLRTSSLAPDVVFQGSTSDHEVKWAKQELTMEKTTVFNHYKLWCTSRNRHGDYSSDSSFFTQLTRVCKYRTVKKVCKFSGTQTRHAEFPTLQECKTQFSIKYKGVDFSEDEEGDEYLGNSVMDFINDKTKS